MLERFFWLYVKQPAAAQAYVSESLADEHGTRAFTTAWFTVPKRKGAVTITISVAYPGAPTQTATIPITLT